MVNEGIRLIPQPLDQQDTQPIAIVARKATKLFNDDTIETNNLTNNSLLDYFLSALVKIEALSLGHETIIYVTAHREGYLIT